MAYSRPIILVRAPAPLGPQPVVCVCVFSPIPKMPGPDLMNRAGRLTPRAPAPAVHRPERDARRVVSPRSSAGRRTCGDERGTRLGCSAFPHAPRRCSPSAAGCACPLLRITRSRDCEWTVAGDNRDRRGKCMAVDRCRAARQTENLFAVFGGGERARGLRAKAMPQPTTSVSTR